MYYSNWAGIYSHSLRCSWLGRSYQTQAQGRQAKVMVSRIGDSNLMANTCILGSDLQNMIQFFYLSCRFVSLRFELPAH